ncbi:MAG: bifunctional sugar-binding transcriptional regulator/dihydroxyacetone kinase subunit DhaK [Cypionkella sp.]
MARPKLPTAAAIAADRESGIPLRFGDDPLLWAAWLYYEEGMTQGDIAEAIGVSRATVNAYLADARARGVVNIQIVQEKFQSLTISKALKDHFGLEDCMVIPTDGGDRALIQRLGAAGAQVLNKLMKSGDTLGITWGRTTLALAVAMRGRDLQDMRVVQATGGTTAKIKWTPEACATRLAEAIGARCIPISAPAIVSSAAVRDLLLREAVLAEQFAALADVNRIILGISSLRPESTIHTSGFFDDARQHSDYVEAVGSIAGRFINARGEPVVGPLEARTIGIELAALRKINQRIAVAGGFDKVPAMLAALRGGYVSVLVTDSATGRGILTADSYVASTRRSAPAPVRDAPAPRRSRVKKLINNPGAIVDESLEGAVLAHAHLIAPIGGSLRSLVARDGPRPGKVGLVIGGGAGHEPGFLGYVGRGLADAVAVGNVFASPPPDPILACTLAANGGAGVLYVYGNYSGDVMNFDTAAEMAQAQGIPVRTIVTTDDIASSPLENRGGRRGVAGNMFIFKIAGAACDRMLPLDTCEALTRHANTRTYTVGIALEPCSMPDTQRPSFVLGDNDIEIGVGVHGEPGVARQSLGTADEAADLMIDRILSEMAPSEGDRVAVLVNSLGGTPMMELYVINRRVRQRLKARGIAVHTTWVGHYFTSLDMVGVSLSLLHLDETLTELLDAPCNGAAMYRPEP